MMPDYAELVFEAPEIAAAVERIAEALERRCAVAQPLLLSVLLGALPFTAALLPRLRFPYTLDTIHVSRYRDATRGGDMEWHREPEVPLEGRTVVLLDDVLDDGVTLAALRDWCHRRAAAEVISAVLVRKVSPRRPADVVADLVGLDAGPDFLFGFGMDYRGRYRGLNEIYRLRDPEGSDD